jgi:hypothetical protein
MSAETDRPPTVPFRTDELEAFSKRHAGFVERFPDLERAANAAFEVAQSVDSDGDPPVVFLLIRQAAQDFIELLALAATGYGLGAFKILRGMYERVVTAGWLHKHPEETERFLNWETIQRSKRDMALLDGFADTVSPEQQAVLRKSIDEAKLLREQFKVTDCEKCGTRRMGHSWASRDLVSMVRDDERLGQHWVGSIYYEALKYSHATPGALNDFLEVRGGELSLKTVHREEADRALQLGHYVLLVGLELLVERAGDAAAKSPLEAAADAFRIVWSSADGNPSREAQAR